VSRMRNYFARAVVGAAAASLLVLLAAGCGTQ
jgi:hypothetical protein